MTTHEAAAQLAEWIGEDIEDAQASATAVPPSSQRRLLTELIRQIVSSEVKPGDAIKLLGIAQAMLSGSYVFLNEPDAIKRFEQLVAFSMAQSSAQIRDPALTVAALFLNRVRQGLRDVPESTVELIKQGLRDEISSRQKSLLSRMLRRIEAATQRHREGGSSTSRKFNVPDLDIPNAAKNVQEDVHGDWYQDPWGWPEVEWLARTPQKVLDQLREGLCSWTLSLDVSKRGGGIRPAMVLNPLDRVAYQSLVDEISVEAAGHLPSWVHGWRLARSHEAKGTYEPNKSEWKLFSRRVADLCKRFRFTAHLDIQSFFPTIDTSRLLSQLGRRYRNAAVLDRLETYFEAWHLCQNGLGLPQRSLASSVLAHAVLRPLDVFLDQQSSGGASTTFQATRWMDDIWLHSDNEGDLRSCLAEVEVVLAQSRLSLNSEKTSLFQSANADRFVQLVDVYEEDEEADPSITLSELLERTARSEGAPAFHVGLEVAKILSKKDFSSLAAVASDDFLQFNYLAGRLAKAFRISGDWKRFTDTFLEIARSKVSEENWSVAAWAEMFPNNPDRDVEKVHDFFSANVVDNLQRLLAPLAAQRLASWSSRFGLGRLPEIDWGEMFHQRDVFSLRGICFATLKIGGLRDRVRAAITHTDDGIIGDFLKDMNFEPPALSARFQSE
jgi:hypothetical protein